MKELLSQNFALFEMCKTNSGLKNEPDLQSIINLTVLCTEVLQPVRDHLCIPIRITSGFRSKEVNEYVKGSEYSQHLEGQAADFVCAKMPEAFEFIEENIIFDQLIWESGTAKCPSWIHVSFNPFGLNRMETIYAYNK